MNNNNPTETRFYFSGADTKLLIGGAWLEDAIELSYRYSYENIPIYGYKSTHWDALPKAKVIVAGSLSINFKQPGYLYAFIKNQMDKEKELNNQIKALSVGNGPNTYRYYDLVNQKIQDNITQFWNSSGKPSYSQDSSSASFARPELIPLVDIVIKDNNFTQTLLDVKFGGHSSVRRADDGITVEAYEFVGRSIL